MTEEENPFMSIFEALYHIGQILVEDDINDFPWDPMNGGRGHLKGTPHHGMIGFMLREIAKLGYLAASASEMAKEVEEDEFIELMRNFEHIAYPEASL